MSGNLSYGILMNTNGGKGNEVRKKRTFLRYFLFWKYFFDSLSFRLVPEASNGERHLWSFNCERNQSKHWKRMEWIERKKKWFEERTFFDLSPLLNSCWIFFRPFLKSTDSAAIAVIDSNPRMKKERRKFFGTKVGKWSLKWRQGSTPTLIGKLKQNRWRKLC